MSEIFGVPFSGTVENVETGVEFKGQPAQEAGNTVSGAGTARTFIDQLFGDQIDPAKAALNLSSIGKAEAQTIQTVNALRNAIEYLPDSGSDPQARNILVDALDSYGSQYGEYVGTFFFGDIADAIEYHYIKNVKNLGALTYRDVPTSDFVFDTSIKPGSTCKIEISSSFGGKGTTVLAKIKESVDSSSRTTFFDKFSVQSVSEPDEERYQIVQTLGADVLYAFGKRPRMIMLSGSIVNGRVRVRIGNEEISMDWKNALRREYNRSLRSTKLIRNQQTVNIYLQDTVYTGYLLNLITNTTSESQNLSQVTMTILLKKERYLSQADEIIPGKRDLPLDLFGKRFPREYATDPEGYKIVNEQIDKIIEKRIKALVKKTKDVLEEILKELSNGVERGNIDAYHSQILKDSVNDKKESEAIKALKERLMEFEYGSIFVDVNGTARYAVDKVDSTKISFNIATISRITNIILLSYFSSPFSPEESREGRLNKLIEVRENLLKSALGGDDQMLYEVNSADLKSTAFGGSDPNIVSKWNGADELTSEGEMWEGDGSVNFMIYSVLIPLSNQINSISTEDAFKMFTVNPSPGSSLEKLSIVSSELGLYQPPTLKGIDDCINEVKNYVMNGLIDQNADELPNWNTSLKNNFKLSDYILDDIRSIRDRFEKNISDNARYMSGVSMIERSLSELIAKLNALCLEAYNSAKELLKYKELLST